MLQGALIELGVGLISLLITIPCLIWLYRDAESRGMDGTKWLIIGLVGGCIGCIIYLIVREDNTSAPPSSYNNPSPNYQSEVPSSGRPDINSPLVFCPYCNEVITYGQQFCQNCGKELN